MLTSSRPDTEPNILTDVLSARVPPGFAKQVRQAARIEGCKPGALIREAVSERIARAGVPAMNDDDRARVRDFGGDKLVSVVERAEADPEFRDRMEREVSAARYAYMDRLISVHRHLGTFIAQQAAMDPNGEPDPQIGAESLALIRLIYAEIADAQRIDAGLGRIILGAEV